MRLKQLDLIKYGKFDGETLEFQKNAHDFHIIVGPNEAGKSTVRNAVLELLFGMPNKTPLGFRHEVNDLRLGGVVESEAGEITFHRARGRSQLRTPGDEKLSDDYLASILGGTSKDFFEQMFGLDHERLIEGGRSILDASKDLGRILFQSASGIGSLGPVKDALEARLRELWLNRGSSEYAQAETRFKEASQELKDTLVRTAAWSKVKSDLDQVEEKISEARHERLKLETLRSKLERVRRLAPLLRELTAKEAKLAELGEVISLPPSAYSDLIKSQADLAGANKVLTERIKDFEARQRDRAAIKTDPEVLALSHDIEALNEARGACLNHPRDLPIRQAEVKRLLNDAFAAAQQLSWPIEEQALRDALPSKLALKTVTNLLQQQALLFQASENSTALVAEKEQDLEALRVQLAGLIDSSVPDELRQALSDALALKNSRAKQATFKTEMEKNQRKFDASLAALGRWRNPPEILRAMALPSPSRVAGIQRQLQESVIEIKNAREKLTESTLKLERLLLEEKHLSEGRKLVTHTEVLEARSERDAAWSGIKTGAVSIEAGTPAVDIAIRLADELVDAQLGSVTEAASLQSIRQQAELARVELAHSRDALNRKESELALIQTDWLAIMNMAGLSDMSLEDFPEWLLKREAVFAAEDALNQSKFDLNAEESAYEVASSTLFAAYKKLRSEPIENKDLASLITVVTNYIQNAEAAFVQKGSLEQQIMQAERSLNALKNKADNAVNAYEAWREQWQKALLAANLNSATNTLAQASGAVELANLIAEKLEAAEEIRRNRIDTMQADLNALEAEARRICAKIDKALLSTGDWPEVTRQLAARLRNANTAAQAAKTADDALREASARKDEAEISVANAEARIQPLLKLVNVNSVEEALPLAQRSDKRRELQAAIDQSASALLRDGDGLTRKAIEAEVAEQNLDSVVAALEQAKRELAEVIEQERVLAQQQLSAQQAFDAINGAANAANAEAKRQEALAAMGDVAEQYVEIATARRLLKWAIDRYRDQKQGPMLQRAGEIFSQLTLEHFSRLVVDHEINPPALFAKRKNGKLVEVAGLSEGTRDQLFLALRIAALELHLQNSVALPFIADDLFVNFDDDRSRAGFEALRELSTHTQVIFLTHHEHLIPLVQDVFGSEVDVVQLKRELEAA